MCFVCCSKYNKEETAKFSNDIEYSESDKSKYEKPIQWYYFSNSGYDSVLKPIDGVEFVPAVIFLPWTEAVRVCSLILSNELPVFLVNKAGILPFFNPSDEPEILSNKLFKTKTSDDFYSTEIGVLTGFYSNTVFSSVSSYDGEAFLYGVDMKSGQISPIISHKNFDLPYEAQLSHLEFRSKWFISFKTEKNNQVWFDYFSFDSFENLLQKNYDKISRDAFMQASSPVLINKERFYSVNKTEISEFILNKNFPLITAEVFSYNAKSKNIFVKGDLSESFEQLEACACEFADSLNKTNIKNAVLFGDGELIFSNYDSQRSAFFLPHLPDNFTYTYFSIYGNHLIAGWEEQSFFSVGRSGVLFIDLSKWNGGLLPSYK